MPTLTCAATGETVEAKQTAKGNTRLPRGWKRIAERTYSPEGWQSKYHLSAVIVPIVGLHQPEEGLSEEQIKSQRRAGWETIGTSLRQCWSNTTALANWCLQSLLARDHHRDPETGKLPKLESTYLYGEAREEFDLSGWSTSANSVIRTVEQTYRKQRGEMLYFGRRRLPDVRYPYPYPVHNQGWNIEEHEGRYVVSFPTPNGRLSVLLMGGPRYRRQRGRMKRLVTGEAVKGEASIYRRGNDVLVKLVAYFPRTENGNGNQGTLHVRTDSDSFLIALNDKQEKLWIVNGDRIKREIVKHAKWQQREREDRKFETRRPHRTRKARGRRGRDGAKKYRNRMDSFVKETAAQVAGYAHRRRLAKVVLDDSDRRYFGDRFPYHEFVSRLAVKCDELGIAFEQSDAEKTNGTARKSAKAE